MRSFSAVTVLSCWEAQQRHNARRGDHNAAGARRRRRGERRKKGEGEKKLASRRGRGPPRGGVQGGPLLGSRGASPRIKGASFQAFEQPQPAFATLPCLSSRTSRRCQNRARPKIFASGPANQPLPCRPVERAPSTCLSHKSSPPKLKVAPRGGGSPKIVQSGKACGTCVNPRLQA
jgi:hypothetical protein